MAETSSAAPTQDQANPADAGSPGASGNQAAPDGGQQSQGGSPAAPPTTDDVYAQAFEQFLGPNAPADPKSATAPANGQEQDQQAQAGQSEPASPDPAQQQADEPELTPEQQQLLARNHVQPSMIAGWTDQQRQDFLANLEKREADNTRTFKELRDRVQQLEKAQATPGQDNANAGQGQGQQQKPGEGAGDPGQGSGGGSGGGLVEQVQSVVDSLVDTYGDEMKPLGDLMGHVNQELQRAQQQAQQASQAAASLPLLQQVLVEMTIDSGVRDLVGDYPSLSKAEARQKVVKRFETDWQASPHRTAEGPMLDRIKAALADAAKAELGTQTESAAQVALANKTKQRLRNQPQPGSGRGTPQPKTEDDVYDQAFQEYLKPELTSP